MATAGGRPVANPHRGRADLEAHLPLVLRGDTLEARGWCMPTALSLLVPMTAGKEERTDEFLLLLGFEYYCEWPPSASFVNPETRTFDAARDLYWVPKVMGDPGLRVHAPYQIENRQSQLICCSFTAEFYLIQHGVQPEHLWNQGEHTFEATIHRIQRGLWSEHYEGRFSTERPKGAA